MLAAKRLIRIAGQEIERTPLLVPSFSSKGFPEVENIMQTTAEVIEGPILVSAYDLHYKKISSPFDYASLLFLDSGGYEASRDAELSDYGAREHAPNDWIRDHHNGILKSWSEKSPTIAISYDHPAERIPFAEQIARGRTTLGDGSRWGRELLLKPETSTQVFLPVKALLPHVRNLAGFEVIGVTEKEIGSSILERMVNIAKLRRALTEVGLQTPIHVFGSLDTVTTPMYFLAGADIFDGLTWLRFAYLNGYTVYKQNYSAIELGFGMKMHLTETHCWFNNYRYLTELQLTMRRFLITGSFGEFGIHGQLFERAFGSMTEQLEG